MMSKRFISNPIVRKLAVVALLVTSLVVLAGGWQRWELNATGGNEYADLDFGTQLLDSTQIPSCELRFSQGMSFSKSTNLYLGYVGEVIEDEKLKVAIEAVQPACVSLGGGSGICVDPRGFVLTNAHVALKLGKRMIVVFPDGGQFVGICFALNRKWDLALIGAHVHVGREENRFAEFPFVMLADHAGKAGDKLVCIGQPGKMTPGGKPTGYKRFEVSVGSLLEMGDDPLGDQSVLGQVRHDAWTYWGHSGSPLLNTEGQLVALHNGWDATREQRHAVSYEAIVAFLREAVTDIRQ